MNILQQVIKSHGLESRCKCENTLVTLGSRFTIESCHGDYLRRHVLALSFALNGVEDVRRILRVGDVDLLDCSTTCLQ